MIDTSYQGPQQVIGAPAWARRPRLQAGETVDGWVVAEITPYPCPLRPVQPINAIHLADSFMGAPADAIDRYVEAHYTPPTAQFVLAVMEYPSGPVTRWGRLTWSKVEIILRSAEQWTVPSAVETLQREGAPPQTSALRRLVDELAQQAMEDGWEPAGCGRTWCSLRFRQRHAHVRGSLRWK